MWPRSSGSRRRCPALERAIAYAEREGIAYHVVPPGKRTLQIRAYADNFTMGPRRK